MRYLITVLGILLITSTAVYSQHSKKPKYVVAPSENILLATASQPNCPLKIENARLLLSVDGNRHSIYQYRLINRGTKPINYFTVVAWHSGGGGGTMGNPAPWDGRITNRLLMPGRVVPTNKEDSDVEIVPLTAELRTKLGLSGSMKSVVVLLVDQITFADRSIYDDRKASEMLADFLENVHP